MKIYNTNQEIGCRILLILEIVKQTYSIERIGYYDYFSLHFNDLKKTGQSLGNRIVDMFDNEYTKKYQYYVKEVDKIFSKMNEDKIRDYVNRNIGKWIGEFEKNGN